MNNYLRKHPKILEKLRLLIQDRKEFLKWLGKDGLVITIGVLDEVRTRPWNDCWEQEKSLLRKRWEEDLRINKERNANEKFG